MDDLITQAAQSGDYLLLGVAVLLVLVPAGLKLAGKSVPGLDAAIEVAKKMLLSRSKIVPVKPEDEKGIAAVVDIQEARKGPPEP